VQQLNEKKKGERGVGASQRERGAKYRSHRRPKAKKERGGGGGRKEASLFNNNFDHLGKRGKKKREAQTTPFFLRTSRGTSFNSQKPGGAGKKKGRGGRREPHGQVPDSRARVRRKKKRGGVKREAVGPHADK